MKLQALAALAFVPALATPALAGPYVETKSEFKGVDEDFKGQVHQGRVGYDWKEGNWAPYIEGGAGINTPDAGDPESFTVVELGTKVKLTDDLSAYIKGEQFFFDDESKWKVEIGTKYRF